MKYLLPLCVIGLAACSQAKSNMPSGFNGAGPSAIFAQSDITEDKAPRGSFFRHIEAPADPEPSLTEELAE